VHVNPHSSAAHLDSYLPGIHHAGFRCGPTGWSGVWDGHSGGQNTVVSKVLRRFKIGPELSPQPQPVYTVKMNTL